MKLSTSKILPKIVFLATFLVFFLVSKINMTNFKIGTLNLNGARDGYKRMMLYEFSRQKQIDILFLQETHSDFKNENDWKREWDGQIVLSHKSSVSGGVAVLFSKHILPLSCEVEEIIGGRLLKIKVKYEKVTMVLLNLYAPTKGLERVLFFDKVDAVLKDLNPDDMLFIGGDFNCTANSKLDRNHIEPHAASQKILIQLIETHDLCDIWRNMNQDVRQYTWAHSTENYISLARLDRIYSVQHQRNLFKFCKIIPVGFSDHSLVLCSVLFKCVKYKSAYWIFNTSLLNDEKFLENFSFFWKTFKQQKHFYVSLSQWWDCGKVLIRDFCQKYTLNVTRDLAQSMKILETEITVLQDLLASKKNNRKHIDDLKEKKSFLVDLLGVKAKGALVRSRFQTVAQMDAPSKFFFNLEIKKGQSKMIHTLRSATGQELTEPADIRCCAVGFFSDLYKSELRKWGAEADHFLEGLPKVDEESNNDLQQTLSLKELYTAMMSLDNGKSPGIDGLPVEFYKTLWPVIGEDLLTVFNDSLKRGLLPLSCRRAVITLLPKKGDLQYISNWRPVSLLCSEYKILSKTLAMRLSKIISKLIHCDQTYCIPNRSIFDNIALIRDVFDASKLLGINSGMISLDQEKAFDRVEHLFLWSTLKAFGFNDMFISMIKAVYCNIESVLKINGGLCAPFKVERGVRQGCPMSGMLYSLAIEPLLQKLRIHLKGLSFPDCNNSLHLSAYADDVIVFVNEKEDVIKLEKIVNDFKLVSSAKVNWRKSEAIMVGSWSGDLPALPGGLIWKRGGLKYLGVYLGNENFIRKNWEGLIEKIKGRLEKWKWLLPQISYRGRILIINNLVASSLWHKLACVDPPNGLLVNIQRELVNFFWDKYHWTPQSILFLPKEEGGQGLVNLACRRATYRLQYIQKLMMGPYSLVWRPLALSILRRVGNMEVDLTLFLMDHKRLTFNEIPSFYQNLFKVWGFFKHRWMEPATSLHWLLEEPVVFGARFDTSAEDFPGLTDLLCNKKVFKLKHIINESGYNLLRAEKVANLLGVRSIRFVKKFLEKITMILTDEEKILLQEFGAGTLSPDSKDLFPELEIFPVIDEFCFNSPLFNFGSNDYIDFCTVEGKILYKCIVKVTHQQNLSTKTDTVWREKLGINSETKPVWRALYKPPLKKNIGDLQWRILHGAIAVNAFVSILNPTVSDKCPFCSERETIFHCFMYCKRLNPLFDLLSVFLDYFNTSFSKQNYILGFFYNSKQKFKCQVINFIVGQAKYAVYITRRNKIEEKSGQDVVLVFKNMVKSRILIDFNFHKLMSTLKVFETQWCCNYALVSVENEEIVFARDLM